MSDSRMLRELLAENPGGPPPADPPAPGARCRSGCTTKDHASYAECLQAASIQIGNLK